MENEQMKVKKENASFTVKFDEADYDKIVEAFGAEIEDYFDLLGVQVSKSMVIRYAIKQALKTKRSEVLR